MIKSYAEMTDDEARYAITACVERNLRSGVAVADIYAALRNEVGVEGIALDIYPEPLNDGRLPKIEAGQFQFMFMACGPSGATIR